MLLVGTEWTNVTWRVMDVAMSDHLILTLETFTTFAAWAFFDGAVMVPDLTVHVSVRATRCLRQPYFQLTGIGSKHTSKDTASGREQRYSQGNHK